MTDKQIIKEKGNQKCIFYNDDICRKGDKTRDCLNCARVEYHSLYKLNWENQERLETQLKAKEQECEELKKQRQADKGLITSTGKMNYQLLQEYDKLKTALTEIKPILEFYANSNMGEEQPDKTYHIMLNGGYITVYDPKPARQALQKISECEVEK